VPIGSSAPANERSGADDVSEIAMPTASPSARPTDARTAGDPGMAFTIYEFRALLRPISLRQRSQNHKSRGRLVGWVTIVSTTL